MGKIDDKTVIRISKLLSMLEGDIYMGKKLMDLGKQNQEC